MKKIEYSKINDFVIQNLKQLDSYNPVPDHHSPSKMSSSFLSWPNSPSMSTDGFSQSDPASRDTIKRVRHRHSPSQLAALNELYDKTEHPALDQRSNLAKRLGM